jgi:hypothetical protein
MKELITPEKYAENLIQKMYTFIPTIKDNNSALLSAKFCAIQSIKETIDLTTFLEHSEESMILQYYRKVHKILVDWKFS